MKKILKLFDCFKRFISAVWGCKTKEYRKKYLGLLFASGFISLICVCMSCGHHSDVKLNSETEPYLNAQEPKEKELAVEKIIDKKDTGTETELNEQEIGTQFEKPAAVDAGVGFESILIEDAGTQSDSFPSVDAGVGSDNTMVEDKAIQFKAKTKDAETQTEQLPSFDLDDIEEIESIDLEMDEGNQRDYGIERNYSDYTIQESEYLEGSVEDSQFSLMSDDDENEI